MNFLNFLTSGASLLNSSLQSQSQATLKESKSQEKKSTDKSQITEKDVDQRNIISSPNSAFKMGFDASKEEQIRKILMNQEQMLINQYMGLNLQYLTQKLNSLGNLKSNTPASQQEALQNVKHQSKLLQGRKKIKKVNKCGHDDKVHYAKGMCNNCYHKFGRTKKPWNCTHNKLYAAGMCQNCYINNYNRKKREQKDCNIGEPQQEEEVSKKTDQEHQAISNNPESQK